VRARPMIVAGRARDWKYSRYVSWKSHNPQSVSAMAGKAAQRLRKFTFPI